MRVCGHLVVIKEEQRLELNKKKSPWRFIENKDVKALAATGQSPCNITQVKKRHMTFWPLGCGRISEDNNADPNTHTHTDDKKCHCHLESHRFCRRLRSSAPACNKPSIQSAGCESGEVVADTVLYVKSWVAAFSAICSCKLYVLYISFCQIMTF